MNAKLLRALLTHAEDHPELLDTTTYGEARPSGEVITDLAGRALLLSGWTLAGDSTFRSPDGESEIRRFEDIEDEACAALGLSYDELWNSGDLDNLFDLPAGVAVARLRELVELAEAVKANG